MDLVSAIVTSYQRSTAIVERAIQSIVHQSYENVEIILVDDNFNDDPLCNQLIEMTKKYQQVIYVKQDGNKGACAARNLGIEKSQGEYIAFLDDDDEWFPDKIEVQLKVLQKNPEIGMVSCCGLLANDETGEQKEYSNKYFLKNTFSFDDLLNNDCIGSTSQPMIRKECFEKVGGFWEEQPARQDYEMWIRISQEYRIVGIEDCLFIHHLHPYEQITKSNLKSFIGFENIYKKYGMYIKNDIKCEIRWLYRLFCILRTISRETYPPKYIKQVQYVFRLCYLTLLYKVMRCREMLLIYNRRNKNNLSSRNKL